ncbi:hypothetical protein PHYSODRAFT_285355 [Phytophthora sojae]|uniref:Uncharacterized protein n=1 Tax=Phytophthora sojae (strain P6497) TaxID=1094619 RepID=G4Z2E7_PHYSP|nr:hypothetical protein PHYSODRAFT_285355 [Phytophthora sojae]EGZ19988.1 hypothetical protein PHYSODRAFT_285355 [Phytophthora sojae]|eukprot:XP_009522705.1 hypothetical protein PHYSODRAFT_285355 [Phytophthora sojae]
MLVRAQAHASYSTRRTNAINPQVKSPLGQHPMAAQKEVQGPCPVSADLVGGEYEPLASLEVALCTNFQTLPPDSGPESPLPSDVLHR